MYYQLFVVVRIAFENKPALYIVYLEFIMDWVYLIDMFRCFTEPIIKDQKTVTNLKIIASNYSKTWLLLDIYSFYPLAYLRYNSVWEEGSKNNVQNFLD